MSSPGRGYTVGWVRSNWTALAAVALVAVLLPTPALLGHGSSGAVAGTPHRIAHPSAAVVPAAPLRHGVRALGSPTVTGTFFQNTSSFSSPTSTNTYCESYFSFEIYCDPQSQSPSLLNLSNGDVGIGFSQLTNYNTTTCTYTSNATGTPTNYSIWTESRVAFSLSTNGGSSFGSPTYLNTTCPYAQQIEPSFTTSPSGTIVGAYVEGNATGAALNSYAFYPPLYSYYPRYSDALVFVNSTNNGTNFANGTALVYGNVSRPAIATVGDTIYIVYLNLSASASTIQNGYPANQYAASVNLVYSSDQGTTWHGPYTLPGENATVYNTSYSPSITVTPAGKVAVAYDTNRSCINFCGGFYQERGDDVVVATSTTNGTTWNGPYTVAFGVGEPGYFGYSYYTGNFMGFTFQYAPDTSIAYDPSSGNFYVAFVGAYNSFSSQGYYYDYDQSVVYSAASGNGGVSWQSTMASAPEQIGSQTTQGGYYNPVIAVHNGEVFLAYSSDNYSQSCGYAQYLSYAHGEWMSHSLNGLSWSLPWAVAVSPQTYGGDDYVGYTASLIFGATGSPLAADVMPGTETGNYPTYYYPVALEVATVYSGTTVPVTFHEVGLAPGTSWSFSIGGNQYTTTANNTTVTNVPSGMGVFIAWPGPVTWTGYREFIAATPPQSIQAYSSPGNFTFSFVDFAGLQVAVQPPDMNYFDVNVYSNTGTRVNFYADWNTYAFGGPPTTYFYGCPFPWYLPEGTNLDFSVGGSGSAIVASYAGSNPIDYWSGVGNGSFTGLGPKANVTLNGAINESAWALPAGYYNATFQALGLPPTSTFSLSVDGNAFSAPSTQVLAVHNLSTGPHWLSNITANSSKSGWQYIGRSDAGNPLVIPDQPTDNLSFAYENLSAPAGTVTFQANGFTAGTVWSFEFNGTLYSSTTPWINVTTHPGLFTQAAFPVTAQNGSVGYTPVSIPSTVSVVTGGTYFVNFTAAYLLEVVAGFGGRVSPATSNVWVAPGTMKSFTAAANVGYTFAGWTGTGVGSYTGMNASATVTVNGPVVETATFVPLPGARFNLTVQETGIPNGTSWSAYVGGVGYSSTNWQINVSQVYSCAVSGGRGSYGLGLPYEYANGTPAQTRYVPVAPPSTVCGGAATTVHFAPQYFLTLSTTAGGSISAVVGASVISNGSWVASSALVSLAASANSGYQFLGWNGTGNGNYTGAQAQPQVQLFGPVSELAVFAPIIIPPPMRYSWSFQATPGFPAGTSWSLALNGVDYSSETNYLNVTGLLAGSYAVTVSTVSSTDGQTEWRPVAPAPLHLSANGSSQVAFGAYYWFSIRAVGPGTVTPSSDGWFAAGSSVTLVASATAPALFAGWTGSGTGSYTGPLNQSQIHVNAPVSEVATFVPPAPAAKTVSSAYTSSGLLVGLAVVGLVVGLIVGLLAARMRGGRGGRPGPMTPPGRPEPVGPSPGGPSSSGSSDYMEDESTTETPPSDGGLEEGSA
ncbi:MAG: hypothetical protein L3K23_06685 [Thermoplasmata archaeon]|nr:hypothetical protein [Thermoplasmata archaeon]